MLKADVGVARMVLGRLGVSSTSGGSNRFAKGDCFDVEVLFSRGFGVIVSTFAGRGGVEGTGEVPVSPASAAAFSWRLLSAFAFALANLSSFAWLRPLTTELSPVELGERTDVYDDMDAGRARNVDSA